MFDLQTALMAAAVANLVALNGKIVWDWLVSVRKGDTAPTFMSSPFKITDCPLHSDHHKALESLKHCNDIMKRDITRQDIVITERTTEIFKTLGRYREDFKQVMDSISEINDRLARLETKLDRK
jgi:hypothetical protein